MLSSSHLNKLKSLLKDFYTLTHMRITVFNNQFEELCAYPESLPSFCQIIRSGETAKIACKQCDKAACETASQRHSTYIYKCHAGLTEAISPIYFRNILIGYLFFGHVFSYNSHEEGWTAIKELCHSYSLDLAQLKTACYQRPIIPDDYINSASHLLRAVASYLCLERMVVLPQQELPVQIDQYLNNHLSTPVSVQDICNHFQIGRTSLYKIARQSYGMGIAEHTRNLRLEKAKHLLIDAPELSVAQVAADCGFSDYNYFITVFKQRIGLPPKQFRKQELEIASLEISQ